MEGLMHNTYGFDPRSDFGSSVYARVHAEQVVGVLSAPLGFLLEAAHPLLLAVTLHELKGEPPTADADALEPRALAGWVALIALERDVAIFGGHPEAGRVAQESARLHSTVEGELPERVGRYPVGSRYSATDPELQVWAHVSRVYAAELIFSQLVHRLGRRERRAYWTGARYVGRVRGLDGELMPGTYAAYRAYVAERLASADLAAWPAHRDLVVEACGYVTALMGGPLMPLPWRVLVGLLPPRLRDTYGLRSSARRDAAVRRLGLVSRIAHRLIPAELRLGSSAQRYRGVLAAVAAARNVAP
jgi:uncharacterized protein (DUF2236 family)